MNETNIRPLGNMVLCKKLEDDVVNNKKTSTRESGLIIVEKSGDFLKENQYVKFKVIELSKGLPEDISVGDIVGVDYNAEKGIGIENIYLVPFQSIKYVVSQ